MCIPKCDTVPAAKHATLCRFDELSCCFCCDAFEVHLLKSRDFLFFSYRYKNIIVYGSERMRLSQRKRLTDRRYLLDGKVTICNAIFIYYDSLLFIYCICVEI